MNDLEFRTVEEFRDESGASVSLRMFVRPIEQTTMHTVRFREVADGRERCYEREDGNWFKTDPYATDGSIVCDATKERLWPVGSVAERPALS